MIVEENSVRGPQDILIVEDFSLYGGEAIRSDGAHRGLALILVLRGRVMTDPDERTVAISLPMAAELAAAFVEMSKELESGANAPG